MTAGHRYLILGTGMGEAIAYALLQAEETAKVTIADISTPRLEEIMKNFRYHPKLSAVRVDVTVLPCVRRLMRGHDVVVAAVNYEYNAILTKIAIEERIHFIDLGGNNDIVAKQFALNDAAKKAGVTIIPDNGIAPGAVSIFTMHALDLLGGEGIDCVHIRVGGLPQHPKEPLGYTKTFSIKGLVNEYIEPALALQNGKEVTVGPLGGRETIPIEGIGDLEAEYTSGGCSTLTKTLAGHVNDLNYKTLRWPGHWEKIHTLLDLDFFSESNVTFQRGARITPREMTEYILRKSLHDDRNDFVVTRIMALCGNTRIQLDSIDRYDTKTGLTAMQRTTGFSAAIVARFIAEGEITNHGTLRLEKHVPIQRFISEWKALGLDLRVSCQKFSFS